MAEDKGTELFTKKARNKLRSPDDLNVYVRVVNPSGWIVLAICAILLIGLFAWGAVETAETSVQAMGTRMEDKVACYLPSNRTSKIRVGDTANADGHLLKVASISAVPVSRNEAHEMLVSDYLANTLVTSDWSSVVLLEGNEVASIAEGVPLNVTITTERVAPMSLVFGGKEQ